MVFVLFFKKKDIAITWVFEMVNIFISDEGKM